MIERLRIRPAAGLMIRDPFSRLHLPPEGATVTLDTYWRRRLACGDCVAVDPEEPSEGEEQTP